MSVLRDNTIELFGKTIFLSPQKLAATHLDASSVGGFAVRIETCDDESSMEVEEIGDFDGKKHAVEVEADSHQAESNHKGLRDGSGSSGIIDLDLEGSSNEGLKSDGQRGDTTGVVDGKNLKRPDKILPCPRCNSTETKFCYYNNYNVNQPRHFCKKCQRYWTAGGSMRNVPVGSGRRKTKSSSGLFCRQALVNEVAPCSDSNGFLRFGSDAPLRDSMANALNTAENRENYCQMVGNRQTGLSKPNMSSSCLTEKGNESQDVTKNFQGFPLQMPCYPAQPWPIAWNTSMPPPHMGVSGYPVACYSMQNYWTSGMMGSWVNPNTISSPSSSPNSPTLGKHSRDGTIMNTTNSDDKVAPSEPKVSRGIWIPKTLRIDDPNQASKSSIWETLGIQNEKSSIKEGSIFTSFPSEDKMGERLGHKHTNPAALSRSQNFHEATPMKHTSN